jgi:hypothetical protein
MNSFFIRSARATGLLVVAVAGASFTCAGTDAATPSLGATGVVKLTGSDAGTLVSPGYYYTQVDVRTNDFSMPSDDNGRKDFGKSLLSAFGLGNKTKSLTISIKLSEGGQDLPEIPLVTYSFNGKGTVTNYSTVDEYLSPRWQLQAADTISATLDYKYSEQSFYDPKAITTSISALIPSGAIVSTMGGPFISSLASLAATAYADAGTRTVNVGVGGTLLPYNGGVGKRSLSFSITLPNGQTLGSISATLLVSPTVQRPAVSATGATLSDLAWKPGEDAATLSLNVGTAQKWPLQEIEGLPEYVSLSKTPTAATVGAFCKKADGNLTGYKLTYMDHSKIIYQAMSNAGFDQKKYNPGDNNWLTDCFLSGGDRDALIKGGDVSFTPPKSPPPPPALVTDWPKSLKGEFGCWITGQAGNWCTSNAPNAGAALTKAMADNIRVDVMELGSIDALVPVGRLWAKNDMLLAIKGQADGFSCFASGLILTKDHIPYNVSVRITDGLIDTIQIAKADAASTQCLSM